MDDDMTVLPGPALTSFAIDVPVYPLIYPRPLTEHVFQHAPSSSLEDSLGSPARIRPRAGFPVQLS